MKQKKSTINLFFFLFISLNTMAQGYRNAPINRVWDVKLGFKCILIGGLIWGIGMLLSLGLRKNESGTVKDGQFLTSIVGILCVGGALTVLLGFILLGF